MLIGKEHAAILFIRQLTTQCTPGVFMQTSGAAGLRK